MTVSYTSHGNGPAMVFLHGVGSGKEGFANQIDPVVSNGWQFIAVDAPGFGETPLPGEPGFRPHVGSVLEAMNHLDIESAVLCGHSLGGMTAQEIYASNPDRVSGLILSATSPAFGRPDGEVQKKFLQDRFAPFDNGMTMPEFAAMFAPNLVGPDAVDGAIDEIITVMQTVSIEAYRRTMHTITTFDQRANLPNIDVPTLLISGELDKNSPAPMMQKMASKIVSANYVGLPRTGHMAPIENPEGFNHHLVEYIKRVSSP